MICKIGDIVSWDGFASPIAVLRITRVTAVSECGKFAHINWVWHPVPVTELKHAQDDGFWKLYK